MNFKNSNSNNEHLLAKSREKYVNIIVKLPAQQHGTFLADFLIHF